VNLTIPPRVRTAVVAVLSAGVFVASWLFRFNDPGGSFAGLTDDHFFYVVRGWQILFGDLPVRDFVDHGAPLYYYVAAAVQELFGRGTLSELAFSTTVLSLSAVLTFLLSTRASGSIVAGLAACLLHVWLGPRFYNYPKVLVYAVAIPLLWRFADRPSASLRVDRRRHGDRVSLPSRPWSVRRRRDGGADAVVDGGAPRRSGSASGDLRAARRRAGGALRSLHSTERRSGVVLPPGVGVG
jgi:hypothetical protein